MKKYIISIGSGLLVLVFAYLISNFILNFNKVEESLVSESSKLVKVITVQNSINPISLSVDGRVKSKNRINLYSEVSGILNFNENTFVEGNSLKKNEIIFSVNSDEFHKILM